MTDSYWSAAQAAIWIATRDEHTVRRVLVAGTSLPLTTSELPDSLYGLGLRLAVEIAYSRELGRNVPFVNVDAASVELANACGAGRIEMLGLLGGQGDPVAIPSSAWAFLEIRDQTPFGVVAASPNKLATDASWWSTLRVRSAATKLLWQPRSVPMGYRSETDFAAFSEVVARRRRLYPMQPPVMLELAPDGLPNRAETSIVEAVCWLATGRAIPQEVWGDYADFEWADLSYDSACKFFVGYANDWRAANAAVKMVGDTESEDASVVRREQASAQSMAVDAWQQKKVKKGALRKTLAALRTVRQSYTATHSEAVGRDGLEGAIQRYNAAAERKLFDQLIIGTFECRGRRGIESPTWDPLPKDCFRHPVHVRLNHNILEPNVRASIDDVKIIRAFASPWIELRIDTAALRAAFGKNANSSPKSPEQPATAPASVPTTRITAPQTDVDKWYEERIATCLARGDMPGTADDEEAARSHFGSKYNRDRLRNARSRLAPQDWKKSGKRRPRSPC